MPPLPLLESQRYVVLCRMRLPTAATETQVASVIQMAMAELKTVTFAILAIYDVGRLRLVGVAPWIAISPTYSEFAFVAHIDTNGDIAMSDETLSMTAHEAVVRLRALTKAEYGPQADVLSMTIDHRAPV